MDRPPGTDRPLRSLFVVYLKGVCMGAADAVPGVSGGTIALITGIYERLIAAITAVTPGRIRRVLAAPIPGRRADALAAVREVDGVFLAALGGGVLTAVLVMTRLLHVALESEPVLTFGFFFGLIAASAAVLASEATLDTPGRAVAAVAGFLLAFLAAGRAGTALPSTPLVVVAVGAVAISAMVLPGISGSLILVILGQYEFLVGRLTAFVDGLFGLLVGDTTVGAMVAPTTTVVAFGVGAVAGLLTVAHAVRWALAHYRYATLAFLVSLVVGGLRAPVVQAGAALSPTGWTTSASVAFALAAVVGAVLVLGLDRYTEGIVV
jgi:putative membrane protein